MPCGDSSIEEWPSSLGDSLQMCNGVHEVSAKEYALVILLQRLGRPATIGLGHAPGGPHKDSVAQAPTEQMVC